MDKESRKKLKSITAQMNDLRLAKGLCMARATTTGGFCYNKPTLERNGKRYCWRHDPERLAEEARKRREAERARVADLERKLDRRDLESEAGFSKLSRFTDEQLKKIIAAGGIDTVLRPILEAAQED